MMEGAEKTLPIPVRVVEDPVVAEARQVHRAGVAITWLLAAPLVGVAAHAAVVWFLVGWRWI